jgi:hypothetical protein
VLRAREQLPDPPARSPVQLSTPSVTVTVPAGVPAGELTVKLTVTASPGSDGSGVSAVMVVVVVAGGGGAAVTLTGCVTELEAPSLSVTVRVTWYVPLAEYSWSGSSSLEVPPSPNVQAY